MRIDFIPWWNAIVLGESYLKNQTDSFLQFRYEGRFARSVDAKEDNSAERSFLNIYWL